MHIHGPAAATFKVVAVSITASHDSLFPLLLSFTGNVFVVSLAFADLVVAFYPYPLVLYAIFHDGWSLGDTQCKVTPYCISNADLVLKDFSNNLDLISAVQFKSSLFIQTKVTNH